MGTERIDVFNLRGVLREDYSCYEEREARSELTRQLIARQPISLKPATAGGAEPQDFAQAVSQR
jgi:hypothetical protein